MADKPKGFKGWLFRVKKGSTYYEVDGTTYIDYEKYKVTRNIQDLDSYRDANGELHRNALSNVPIKIELETRPGLTNAQVEEFFGSIRNLFTEPKERKCVVEYYNPELNQYDEENCYMPDPSFEIRNIEAVPVSLSDKDNLRYTIFYKSIRFAFIGYADKNSYSS